MEYPHYRCFQWSLFGNKRRLQGPKSGRAGRRWLGGLFALNIDHLRVRIDLAVEPMEKIDDY